MKQTIYEVLYTNMSSGKYDGVVRTFGNGLNPTTEILVKKVKKACSENNVDFSEFMKYAQERKAKENAEWLIRIWLYTMP